MAWIGSDLGLVVVENCSRQSQQPTRQARRLPREPEARLSALDSLFRETIAGRLSIDASVLCRIKSILIQRP